MATIPPTWNERGRDLWWWLARFAIVAAASGLLALFQLLPTAESLALSNRAGASDFAFAASHGVPKLNWLTYLVPGIFGEGGEPRFWAGWSAWEGQAYLGLAALLLLGTAVILGSRHHWLPLGIAIGAATLLAMGRYTPLFQLYFNLDPVVGSFRVPSRFVLPATLFAAWGAALGFQLALSAGRRAWPRLATVAGLLVGVMTMVWLWLRMSGHGADSSWAAFVGAASSPQRFEQIMGAAGMLLSHARGEALWGMVLAVATGGALVWLVRAGSGTETAARSKSDHGRNHSSDGSGSSSSVVEARGPRSIDVFSGPADRARVRPAMVLVLLVLVDLYVFARPLLTTESPQRFKFPEATVTWLRQHLGTQRMMTAPRLRSLNWGAADGLAHFGGYDTFVDRRYNLAVNRAMGFPPEKKLMIMTLFRHGPFWNVQGVRYLLAPFTIDRLSPAYQTIFAQFTHVASPGGMHVHENRNALPRAFAVHRVKVAPDEETAHRLVTSSSRLVRSMALVHADAHQELARRIADAASDGSRDHVTVSSLTPNEVVIDANLSTAGLVVLTDAPFPGWSVTVDGTASRLYRVNGDLHRAVLVPAGRHTVRFSYFPESLRLGLVVSVTVLLLIAGYLVWGWRRRGETAL